MRYWLEFSSLIGNLEILPFSICLKVVEIWFLDIKKKIHLLPFVGTKILCVYTYTHMNMIDCFLNKGLKQEQ